MKFRLLIVCLLLLPAAACIGNTPTVVTTVVVSTAAATKAPVASATPAGSPYPSPVDLYPTQPQGVSNSIYPGPQSGDTILWEQAVALILNNEVNQVAQAHSLQVTLTLKDGRVLVTEEPEIDAVFTIIQNCGEPCSSILQVTE